MADQFLSGLDAPAVLAAPIRGTPLGMEALGQRFEQLGAESSGISVHRRALGRRLLGVMRRRFSEHAALRGYVLRSPEARRHSSGVLNWLRDNDAAIYEAVRDLSAHLPPGFLRELPEMRAEPFQRLPRAYRLAFELISATDSAVTFAALERAVKAFQHAAPLTTGEVWALPTMLRFVLVDNLVRIMARTRRAIEDFSWAEAAATRACDAAIRLGPDNSRRQGEMLVAAALKAAKRSKAAALRFLDVANDAEAISPSALQAAHNAVRSELNVGSRELSHEAHLEAAADEVTAGNIVTSLRVLAAISWQEFFERVSVVEHMLRRDPAGVYGAQDFRSRDGQRHAVEEVSKLCKVDERVAADAALRRAELAAADSPARTVAYWLVGPGREQLEETLATEGRRFRLDRKGRLALYLGGLAVLTAAFAASGAYWAGASGWAWIVGFLLALMPLSELAAALVNALALSLVRPKPLPKLDFSAGAPEGCETLIVIPALLARPGSGRTLAERLEVHFLANRDDRLHFAIATDFSDAPTERTPEDESLLEEARQAIAALNARHAADDGPRFLLFHRRRLWNEAQGVWMGWERKRGKLAELNRLLRGATDTTYVETTVHVERLPRPEFVITLDADTQLPLGAARRLIGAAAHPLNRPRFDAEGRLEAGYVLFQPRVNSTLLGSRRSGFASLYSGSAGIDPYSVAASDVYQDLFESGTFVGKGLYHLDAFERLTHRAFPENAILSHDLIESDFARCALVSDVQLLDDFPPNFHVFERREHRWNRGDWQLLPWLGGRAPLAPERPSFLVEGPLPQPPGSRPTPIDLLGRWKMFDNLRRSLLPIAAFVLLVAGWFLLPGSPWLWTLLALTPWIAPTLVQALRLPWGVGASIRRLNARAVDLASTVGTAAVETAFLLPRAGSSLDAIVRTLWRLAVSHRNLLEWETAAATERRFQATLLNYVQSMAGSTLVVVALAVGLGLARPQSLPAAAIPLFAWAAAPFLAWVLGQPLRKAAAAPSDAERTEFRRIARRTWAFFETHVGPVDNHLPPDNFQEAPKGALAPRTSPTNMGLYLLSSVAARDLGFASLSQAAARISACLDVMEGLERRNGHFYNWYDTRTLSPLPPKYLSTVDSGNLMGCLMALEQAMLEFAGEPESAEPPWLGIGDTVQLLTETGALPRAGKECRDAVARRDAAALSAALPVDSGGPPVLAALREQLSESSANRSAARDRCRELAATARRLAEGMDFRILYRSERKLFAIGMNLASGQPDNSYYDLLASESALTSLLSVATGVVPVEHWFQLGRPFASVSGRTALVSWGGTMFEYLMPRLLLRVAEGTTLDESHRNAVAIQIAHGNAAHVPWGISESAYAVLNDSGDYSYHAFGVPELGLKRQGPDLVVAPYATALAAPVAPAAAAANFRRFEALGALTPVGFVEALDYTEGRRGEDGRPALVRTYMAHHQGMSLLALANALNGRLMAERLARNPAVRAAEVLLHERIPDDPALLSFPAGREEPVEAAFAPSGLDASPVRKITTPYTAFPRTHLLGNGRLTCMVTNAGGGRLSWNELLVTRWREDRAKDHWGQFLYVRDLTGRQTYSATCQPLGVPALEEEIEFAADRAVFRRVFREIELRLEIAVSPVDDVEVRRLAIVNRTNRRKRIAATSFAEIALATAAADRAHPAFQKLFIETEHVPEHQTILARRRPRTPADSPPWAFHVVACERIEEAEFEAETDRRRFLGRGRSAADPAGLTAALGGVPKSPLDPIFAMRSSIEVPAGGRWIVSFVTGVAATREEAVTQADRYDDLHATERVLDLAWAHSQEARRRDPESPRRMQLHQRLSAQVVFANAAFRADRGVLASNRLDRTALWRHGISGDLPIVLARVSERGHSDLLRELAEAARFWRSRGAPVDLVALDESLGDYRDETHRELLEALHSGGDHETRGFKALRADRMPAAEVGVLRAMARCEFVGSEGSLEDQTAARERAAIDRVLRPQPPEPAAPQELSAPPTTPVELSNPWGGFSQDGREYVVRPTGPEGRTPAPWTNVIANPVFGCLADDGGLGYTWAGNAQLNRITTWFNDPVVSPQPEIVYLRDDENSAVWSATPAPAGPSGVGCEVRHGFGYSRYCGAANGLEHELEVFAAADDPLKYLVLDVRNTGKRPRRITAAYYAELALGGSRENSMMHTVTEFEPVTGALLARNSFDADFANGWTFANAEPRPRSFTCNRLEFLGRLGNESRPAGLRAPSLTGAVGAGFDPCFALAVGVALAPGESRRFVFMLGRADSREAAERLAGRCRDPQAVAADREAVAARWRSLDGALQVKTPDRAFDLLMNGWLLHQTLSSRLWGRTGLYQSGGAFGFRDQLQDAMALVVHAPWELRAQLLRAASRQFEEGDVQHWWHMPTGAGVRTRITDDLLWLPAAVCRYVEGVGDSGVLDEPAHFLRQPMLAEGQEDDYRVPETGGVGTIYEHCVRAFRCAASRDSERGLPLIGTGDWNDGMNHVGPKMKGESVWNAWFQAWTLDDFARIADVRDPEFAEWCRDRAERLREACEEHAWDGGWYIRATFDDGTPLGAAGAEECEIDVLPQSWSAIAGGRPDRVDAAMTAAKEKLIDPDHRLVKLFAPPFGDGDAHPGYIKGYPPGIRENGGQYTHGAVWLAWAETVRGDGAEAKRLFDLLNPALRTGDALRRYAVEPYVTAGDVYGASPHEGRGGWTWYTGSAAWMLRLGIERILGLRREGIRLRVQPCLPPDWPGYEATLVVGKATYRIQVERREPAAAWFDGESQPDADFPYVDDGREHLAVVHWAPPNVLRDGQASSARKTALRAPAGAREKATVQAE